MQDTLRTTTHDRSSADTVDVLGQAAAKQRAAAEQRAIAEQQAAVSELAGRNIVSSDLDVLRQRASRFFATLLWLHVPVVLLIAASNHVSLWRVAAIMIGAALAGTLAARRGGGTLWGRLTIAAGLTTAPALMVYAGRGPWQIDWHMYFFVIFGMLVAYVDWRPIALSAGLTAVHHLLLDLIFPDGVFPEAGLGRVFLHAGVVAVDCLVLFWIISEMRLLFLQSAASLRAAREAAAEAQRLESYAKQGSDLIMQAVNQGLLLCDDRYRIQPQYSAELENIFETGELAEHSLLDLLQSLFTERLFRTTSDYFTLLFDAKRKERTVLKVNPLSEVECSFWSHANRSFTSKFLSFNFRRIVEGGKVVRVFVAVNDITERVKLERQLTESEEKKEQQVELLLSILHIDPAALDAFVATAAEQLHTMNNTLRPQDFTAGGEGNRELLRRRLDTIHRCVHNIKGNAALIDFQYFRKRAHDFETKLTELRGRSNLGGDDFLSVVIAQEKLRSDVDELDDLRSKFSSAPRPAIARSSGESRTSDDLVAGVSEIAASIAAALGKEVRVDAGGFDTRNLSDGQRRAVKDVLVQLARNSITHGVELPERRQAAGKPRQATLTIRPINDRRGEFGFVFRDDGRGFDTDLIRHRAIEQGLLAPHDSLSHDDARIARLIFEPGFSTLDDAKRDSDRGMGMNLVKGRIVDECSGEIEVVSVPGRFCEFRITLPIARLAQVS
jgi:signal transduction histidine kinase